MQKRKNRKERTASAHVLTPKKNRKQRRAEVFGPSGVGTGILRENAEGRSIKMTPEIRSIIEGQIEAFKAKFGREMGPTDPIFFDPNADEPRPFNMEKAGKAMDEMMGMGLREGIVRPELAFAAWATDRILTSENLKYTTSEDRQEWRDAVQEYLDQESVRSRVYRVLMVEAAKLDTSDPEKALEKLLDLAEEIGVKKEVQRRLNAAVMD